ncbi:MAG: ABC transporter ATP-binding protein [Planctomycetota bacterium]|nr:ABC transporter ATP-binding protein [Planctomycetota bacterium]MDA1250377.1 ABC transporter ATP-binding protein [Planctomycetota bacterium]
MSTPLDQLLRVFPIRQLFRGTALRACLWSVVGTAFLAGLVLVSFLVVALLDTRGEADVSPDDAVQFGEVVGSEAYSMSDPELIPSGSLPQNNLGLFAVAWELRDRPLGSFIGSLARRFEFLQQTDSALFYLISIGLLFGLIQNAVLAHVRTLAGRASLHSGSLLRESLHRHALRTGTSDLANSHTASLIQLFTEEVERVRLAIEEWIVAVFRYPLQLALLVLFLLTINWRVAFECAVPLIGCWYLIQRERRSAIRDERLIADRARQELELLAEAIGCSRLIRGYRMEEFERVRFNRHLDRYHQQLAEEEQRESKTHWLARMLSLAAFAIVLFLVGAHMLQPRLAPEHVSLAEGILLLSCFAFGYHPAQSLAAIRHQRIEANRSAERIYHYLNSIPEVGQAVGAKFLEPVQKLIEFENVHWKTGSRKILNGLNLKLPAGGSSAIIAFDSVEADTLVALLPRFIEPHDGKIKFDGEDTAWVTLESLRAEVVVVSGDEAVFTGTVFENLSGGESQYPLSAVTEAAKKAHAHSFIQKLPQGYETVLGQHGEQLSSTQSFRLALARAVLRDPAVMVIHEPTTAMSEDEKSLLDDACQRVSQGRTMVYRPSRLSALKRADRIILLNRGRVEVVGTHEVLVKSSDLYRHWEYLHFNEFRREIGPPD